MLATEAFTRHSVSEGVRIVCPRLTQVTHKQRHVRLEVLLTLPAEIPDQPGTPSSHPTLTPHTDTWPYTLRLAYFAYLYTDYYLFPSENKNKLNLVMIKILKLVTIKIIKQETILPNL